MKTSKNSSQQTYGPLADFTLEATASQVVSKRFDFGIDSAVCQHLVGRTFAALEDEDRRQGVVRLAPFTLRLSHRGVDLLVELLGRQVLDVRDRRMSLKMRLRAHVPVRLTVYHEAELAALEQLGPRDRDAVDELLSRRIARLLTEAYCQGGLLSLTLVGLLTHQNSVRVGRLVDQFEARYGLVLPTPGTIHDAGTKLTHKATVVRMALSGMESTQIARETFHTEEAVDRYLDDFERTLIALGHGLPSHLLPRVLKLGKHVVAQYEELITEHIGDIEQIRQVLHGRGIEVEQEDAA